MDKGKITALVILALVVIVLILQGKDSMDLDFKFTVMEGMKSLMLLAFTGIGVVIGVLLK